MEGRAPRCLPSAEESLLISLPAESENTLFPISTKLPDIEDVYSAMIY